MKKQNQHKYEVSTLYLHGRKLNKDYVQHSDLVSWHISVIPEIWNTDIV